MTFILGNDYRCLLFIKRSLLVLCIIVMIIPVLWIILSQQSQERMVKQFIATIGEQPVNLAFENLTVKMLQDGAKSINITSPEARIHDLKISKIDLHAPKLKLYEKNQIPKFLTADKGIYEGTDKKVRLFDNVKMSEADNYVINADKMIVDLNNFDVKLPDGVDAVYGKNSLKARNVEFDKKSNKATFKGGVRMVIHPNGTP